MGRRKEEAAFHAEQLLSSPGAMDASEMSKTLLLQIDPLNLLSAVIVGTIVHVVYLVCNTVVAQLLAPLSGLANDEVTAAQRVVVLVASQKTLPVAIAVIGKLGGTLGEAGILVLPCIALHVIQITLDSFLVSYWVNSRTPAPVFELE